MTLPLSALLSQALVAFTIEFDNEFEHQMPHTTATGPAARSGRGPWLVSQAMWVNFMRFVEADGVPLRDLEGRAPLVNLSGLERWGYIVVEPRPDDDRSDPPRGDRVVRSTRAGAQAQEIWRPLGDVIERRWAERFGTDRMGMLRRALESMIGRLDLELPHYLPVISPTKNQKFSVPEGGRPRGNEEVRGVDTAVDVSALMAQVLLAFTLDVERESPLSLPVGANTLRVIDDTGVRVRDRPRLTGVSKEANTMAVGLLEQQDYVLIGPDPAADRGKVVRLTAKGRQAQDGGRRIVDDVEKRWRLTFGGDPMNVLRESLEALIGDPVAPRSPLKAGMVPYPDGWRAAAGPPVTLPYYPMVLHRGGFPDGS